VIKTLIAAFILGLALAMAGASLYPLPGHQRIRGDIEAATNGGRKEDFHIELATDRLIQQQPATAAFPVAGFEAAGQNTILAEAFQVRNAKGEVIGIASRMQGVVPDSLGGPASAVNWLLVIPARGAMLFEQKRILTDVAMPDMQALHGRMIWGDREFANLTGTYIEARLDAGSDDAKILLSTRLMTEAE